MRVVQDNQHREFTGLFTREARGIYGYILSLVLSQADAEEIFQGTSLVLWEKFSEFEAGSNFYAWACRIAFFEVQNFRRRKKPVPLSNEFIELMSQQTLEMTAELDDRQRALEGCLQKLPDRDRDVICRRYYDGWSPKQIAEQVQKSVYHVYRTLNRVHEQLFSCIERSVAKDGT